MKKLILTASALAFMAGTGLGYAAGPSNTSNLPAADMPNAATQSTAPMSVSENQVMQAQQQLQTAGLYRGQIDGKVGPETRQALQQWQRNNGLQPTGSLDQQTMAALNNSTGNSGSGMAPSMPPANAGGANSGMNAAPQPQATPANPSTAPNPAKHY